MSAQADSLLDALEQASKAPLSRPAPVSNTAPAFGQSPNVDAFLDEIANRNPNMSLGEDVGRSAVTGLEKGVTGLESMPATVRDAFGHLPQAANDTVSWLMKQAGVEPAVTGQMPNPVNIAAQSGNLAAMAAQGAPTQAQADTKTQHLLGPYHDPQTGPGRYAKRAGEMAAAVAGGPGGLGGKVLLALTSGLGSQAAEDIAPAPVKPYAAAAGALLGGGAAGAAGAIKDAPQILMAKALRDTSPEDIAKATQLRQTAQGMGVHLTPPEALAQVTNGANTMPRLQHFVENSAYGGPKVADIFANRPAQFKGAVQGVADQIAPADTMPGATGLNAQDAAVQVLRNFDKMRSNATRPLYQAADAQTLPPEDLASLHDGLDSAIAGDKTGKIAAVLKQFKGDLTPNGKPLEDVGSLDTIRKIWRDKFDLPPNSPDALGKTVSAKLQPFLDQFDDAMEASSPAFQQGKALHADLSRNVVNPVNNGPLGRIADSSDVGEQTRALYPQAPPEGAANETGMATTLLPKDIAAALTRHNITDTFNNANRDLQPGENQWAGSKFAVQLAGHDEQAKALATGLRALPNGDALNQNVQDLLEVGRATGKRMAPGSQTAFNEQRAAQFGVSPAPIRTASALLDPLEWGKHIDQAVGGAMYRRNISALADMLHASPEEAERMLNAARSKGSRQSLFPLLLAPQASGGSH